MLITCEHCGTELEAMGMRILHHSSGARAVCPRCYNDLRPGADHRLAVPGKLSPAPRPVLTVDDERPETPGRLTRSELAARKGGPTCQPS